MFKRLLMRHMLMNEGEGGGGGGAAGAAGAGAEGAGGAAAGAGGAAAGAQDTAPSFLDTLGDADLKAYAESKGYKSAAEAVKAHRDAEAASAANAAPAKAEDYKLPVPEGQDGALAKQAAGWFHEAGISQKAAESLVTKWNAHIAGLNEAAVAAQKQEGEKQMGELRKEWGGEFDAKLALGQQALHQFGIPADVVSKLESQVGAAQIMKTFAQIGAALGEGVLNAAGGGSESGGVAPLDPYEARARRMFKSSMPK